MIPYHGTPLTSREKVLLPLEGQFFCVPFSDPRDVEVCCSIGKGVMLDNGAFSAWRQGKPTNWPGYYAWAEGWLGPAVWAVIPDVIDGTDEHNDALITQWPHGHHGAPVWHLHEPYERLQRLVDEWPLVCLGSSGAFAKIGTHAWEARMDGAFNRLCRSQVVPRLHGLRMLDLAGKRWPLASADSTDIARNHNRPQNTPVKMAQRWQLLARRTAKIWTERPEQLELAA